MHIANRGIPWKFANGAENLVLQTLCRRFANDAENFVLQTL
jgi:hypothetical protein